MVSTVRQKDAKLTKEYARSLARQANEMRGVATALDDKKVASSLRALTKPPSMKRTMRKVGVALILTPDPVTTAAGVALVGASLGLPGGDPASIGTLAGEAARLRTDLEDLGADLESLSI